MKIKYFSQNMGKENIFTMADGQKRTYPVDAVSNNESISKKEECNKCGDCAPNIEKNNFVIGFQKMDFGICFRNYPKKVSVIGPCIRKKEISCGKIRK